MGGALYQCTVNVMDFKFEQIPEIMMVLKDYSFTDAELFPDPPEKGSVATIDAMGEVTLRVSENVYAKDLAIDVWKANKGPCEVTVDMVCLENLPVNSFAFDESNYVDIMGKV